MVAAMTLRFLDPFGSGKLVLFQVTYDKVDLPDFVPVVILTYVRIGMPTNWSCSFCSEYSAYVPL